MLLVPTLLKEPEATPIVLRHSYKAGQIGVLLIDQMSYYCAPDHPSGRGNETTRAVAIHNGRLLEEFRSAGARIIIASSHQGAAKLHADDHPTLLENHGVDHYQFERQKGDAHVLKARNSIFRTRGFGTILEDWDIRALLILGFNASACVHDSAMDACKKGFQSVVLEDCTANDNEQYIDRTAHMIGMNLAGVQISNAIFALEYLRGLER